MKRTVQGGTTRKLRAYLLGAALGLSALTALFITGLTMTVHALSNLAPDIATVGTNTAYFTLSNTNDVKGSGVMGISVYKSGALPVGNVTLTVTFQGGPKGGAQQNEQGFGKAQFQVGGGPLTAPRVGTGTLNLTIRPSDWVSTGLNGYTVHIGASLNPAAQSADDSNHINFKMSIASAAYVIGADGGFRFAVNNSGYNPPPAGSNLYHRYVFPFAPDCGVGATVASVIIHDMDYPSWIQPVELKVQIIDTTTGTIVNNNSFTGSRLTNGNAKYDFNTILNHKYQVVLNPVNNNNVLQLQLPFDSINSRVVCPVPPTLVCGSVTAPGFNVGIPTNFHVGMRITSGSSALLAGKKFNIKVTGPNSQTYNGVGQNIRGANVTSSPDSTFTALTAGSYAVTWTYNGISCGPTVLQASYLPYFSAKGGDVSAGVGFGAGCTENPADIIGWNTDSGAMGFAGAGTEIGAFATGTITDFVSGLGLSGGAVPDSGHGLSFANAGAGVNVTIPDYGGNFGPNSLPCLPDYYGGVASASPTPLASPLDAPTFNSLVSGNYSGTPDGTGTFVIGDPAHNPVTLSAGQTVTIYVTGNVYITSNILYAPYTLTNVPRLNLYVSGNIYIDPNVTEMHGVYMAQAQTTGDPNTGIITTCAAGPAATTEPYAICNKQLIVYGAVGAETEIRMSRSHGSIVAAPLAGIPAEPAEVFQYTPELWLNTPPAGALNIKAYTSLPPVL